MTNSNRKCGEITFCTQVGKRVYVLNCIYCSQICLQWEMFINHLEQEHDGHLNLEPIVQPQTSKMSIKMEVPEMITDEPTSTPVHNNKKRKTLDESLPSSAFDDPLESENSASEMCYESSIKIEQEEFETEENSSEIQLKMVEFVCKLWSSDRRVKKSFMTAASVEALIKKAHKFGIQGSQLVLENDGTEISSNAVLEYYLKSNSIFMLLENEEWIERSNVKSSTSSNPADVEVLKDTTLAEESSTTSIISSIISPSENAVSSNQHFLMQIPSNTTDDSDCTTLTVSSGALTFSSETTPQAKPLFEHFQIPWQKVPSDILDLLNSGKKLGKKLNALANILVDEMRTFSFDIPMGILRSVTQQAVTKYPESLLEKDSEGNIISVTTSPLLTILRNRSYFLNRPSNARPKILASNIPLKKIRHSNVFKKTCAAWEIQEDIPTGDLELMKSKQNYLKSLFANAPEFQHRELIKSHMKDCYPLQRQFLNTMPSIKDIQMNWPFLFSKNYLYQHFQLLMNIDINVFRTNFEQAKDKFKKVLATTGTATFESLDSDKAIVSSFTRYFRENSDFLFMNFEIGATVDFMAQKMPPNVPVIAFTKRNKADDSPHAFIFIEQVAVAAHSPGYDFVNLIIEVISYYFILNKMYPSQISQTLEFLVRFCYKHYPNQTRGLKKNINSIQKVNNLISRTNNME